MKNNESQIISNSEWLTQDKKKFKYVSWGKNISPKAIIISVHGLSGAASDFKPLGEYLENRNFNIFSINERGQGNDPNKENIGDIKDYQEWLNDLRDFTRIVADKNNGIPIFYYAESLGALITGNLLIENKIEKNVNLKGVIFASPVIKLEGEISWWQNFLFKSILLIKPTQKISFSDLDSDKKSTNKERQRVTRDDKYQESLAKMPHYVDTFSLRFLKNIMVMMENINNNASKIKQNILVVYAGKDIFTKPEYIDKFFNKIVSNHKEKIFFPESYHLLLHDYDKEQVLNEVEKWLNKSLK